MIRLSNFLNPSRSPAETTRRGEEHRNSVTAAADPVPVSVGSIPAVASRRADFFDRVIAYLGERATPSPGLSAGQLAHVVPDHWRVPRLRAQIGEAHNVDIEQRLEVEGLRLAELRRPSRARAYAHASRQRFDSGEWRP